MHVCVLNEFLAPRPETCYNKWLIDQLIEKSVLKTINKTFVLAKSFYAFLLTRATQIKLWKNPENRAKSVSNDITYFSVDCDMLQSMNMLVSEK